MVIGIRVVDADRALGVVTVSSRLKEIVGQANSEGGASAAEYAIVVSLIAAAIAATVGLLGVRVAELYHEIPPF